MGRLLADLIIVLLISGHVHGGKVAEKKKQHSLWCDILKTYAKLHCIYIAATSGCPNICCLHALSTFAMHTFLSQSKIQLNSNLLQDKGDIDVGVVLTGGAHCLIQYCEHTATLWIILGPVLTQWGVLVDMMLHCLLEQFLTCITKLK